MQEDDRRVRRQSTHPLIMLVIKTSAIVTGKVQVAARLTILVKEYGVADEDSFVFIICVYGQRSTVFKPQIC